MQIRNMRLNDNERLTASDNTPTVQALQAHVKHLERVLARTTAHLNASLSTTMLEQSKTIQLQKIVAAKEEELATLRAEVDDRMQVLPEGDGSRGRSTPVSELSSDWELSSEPETNQTDDDDEMDEEAPPRLAYTMGIRFRPKTSAPVDANKKRKSLESLAVPEKRQTLRSYQRITGELAPEPSPPSISQAGPSAFQQAADHERFTPSGGVTARPFGQSAAQARSSFRPRSGVSLSTPVPAQRSGLPSSHGYDRNVKQGLY
ncbi:hypothetical protein VNI00_000330 [Paramarasmius palmivorus]|uniref:Uncharacterized protein n=1 Tax=Paramarasmius palmivorus TaxID=297713 RepID=A0AAW0EF94_9AGAR